MQHTDKELVAVIARDSLTPIIRTKEGVPGHFVAQSLASPLFLPAPLQFLPQGLYSAIVCVAAAAAVIGIMNENGEGKEFVNVHMHLEFCSKACNTFCKLGAKFESPNLLTLVGEDSKEIIMSLTSACTLHRCSKNKSLTCIV